MLTTSNFSLQLTTVRSLVSSWLKILVCKLTANNFQLTEKVE